MDIVWKRLDEITPYENNPRDNDQAVDAVASSIKEFGFKVPIVIDAQGVIMTLFGFGDEESDLADELEDNPYTMATNVPQYEPTGAKPSLSQLYDADKTDDLIAEIEASGLSKEEKGFLLRAAGRHTVFNYGLIAEYYAHASPEMQELMEKSALVIIDVDNAIANGYATLMGEVLDAMGEAGDDA